MLADVEKRSAHFGVPRGCSSPARASAKHGILAATQLPDTPRADHVFWAFIAIIAVSLLAITLTNRGIVRIIGGVLLAGLLVFGVVLRLANESGPDPQGQRGKPTSPAAATTAMELDAIKVDE